MQYWNNFLTEKSWEKLQELKRKGLKFTLIGGWAAFLWCKNLKSRDIDIIGGFEELEKLKAEFNVKKNERLRKFEIVLDEIDVDVYVPYYSKLALPVEELEKFKSKVEGFEVLKPSALVIAKQGAEFNRKNSEKGLKDRIDILSLIMNSSFDFQEYNKIVEKHGLEKFKQRLKQIIKEFKEAEYLGLNLRQLKLKKQELLEKLAKNK